MVTFLIVTSASKRYANFMSKYESAAVSTTLSRRLFLRFIGVGAAAVGSDFLLGACSRSSTKSQNPPNYHYGYWRTLPMPADVREMMLDLGKNPNVPQGANPIDFDKAVLIGTPEKALYTGATLAFAFQLSEAAMSVGVLDPSIRPGYGEKDGQRLAELYVRLGHNALFGMLGSVELTPGDPAKQYVFGAQSFSPLPTSVVGKPLTVSEMNLSIPVL